MGFLCSNLECVLSYVDISDKFHFNKLKKAVLQNKINFFQTALHMQRLSKVKFGKRTCTDAAVNKDGSTVRYVQNLRTTYLAP